MKDHLEALQGKCALVTGSGTGLGREIALEFARQGADVVLHYARSAKGARSAVEEIQDMGRRASVFQADLRTVEACRTLVDHAHGFLGRLDILMNNAGITKAGGFLDVTPDDFDLLMNVNFRGEFFCAQRAAHYMLQQKRRGGCRGVIINMTSVHAFAGIPGHAVYAGTKGAIRSWTQELGVELAPRGIRVNAIAPGWVEVESHYLQIPNYDPDVNGKLIPIQRMGQPIDVAKTCAFMASDAADFLIGQVLVLDGGTIARMSLPIEEMEADWEDVNVEATQGEAPEGP
jgi:glucose 1-dehydrogenase/3-oxoacyl-[acyl-carrier protein] reductase